MEPPFAKEGRGRGALERGRTGSGREEGLGKAVNRAILGAGPWPTADFESQGWRIKVWEGLEVWEALGLGLPG